VKLDRLIGKHQSLGRTTAHRLIAAGRVRVADMPVIDPQWEVDRFTTVSLDDAIIRPGDEAVFIMLHKPAGWLSATKDAQHPTVIDLIDHPLRHDLHIAGRLDRFTTGLLLLTNDGRWSKKITEATAKVPKTYRVTTRDPIAAETVEIFAQGIPLHPEGITTLPAQLAITADHTAELTIWEGRHHQIKRMFLHVGNAVVALHRQSIGNLRLPSSLLEGTSCALSAEQQLAAITSPEPSFG